MIEMIEMIENKNDAINMLEKMFFKTILLFIFWVIYIILAYEMVDSIVHWNPYIHSSTATTVVLISSCISIICFIFFIFSNISGMKNELVEYIKRVD